MIGQVLSGSRRRGKLTYAEFCEEMARVDAGLDIGTGSP